MFCVPFHVTISPLAELPGTIPVSQSSLCARSWAHWIGQQSVKYPLNRLGPAGLSEALMLNTGVCLAKITKGHKNHVMYRMMRGLQTFCLEKRRQWAGGQRGYTRGFWPHTNIREISCRRIDTFDVASEDRSRTSEGGSYSMTSSAPYMQAVSLFLSTASCLMMEQTTGGGMNSLPWKWSSRSGQLAIRVAVERIHSLRD